MTQKVAQALDDRKPQSQAPAALAGGIVDLMVFLEDRLEFGRRDAQPRVPDLDPQFSRTAAAADQHAAALSVFEGVREQIADHLLEQTRIAPDGKSARHHVQRQTRRLRMIGQFAPEAVEYIAHGELGGFDLDRPDFDLIDVEQGVQHARHRAERFIDPADQLLLLLPSHFLGQQRLEQGQRLQGLAQIMARRGEKARLGGARRLRLPLCGG